MRPFTVALALFSGAQRLAHAASKTPTPPTLADLDADCRKAYANAYQFMTDCDDWNTIMMPPCVMEQLDTKQAGKGPSDLQDWYKTVCDNVGAAFFANAMHMCYTQPKATDLPCVWTPDGSPSMTPSMDTSPDVVIVRKAFQQLPSLDNWQGLSSTDPQLLSCYLVGDVPQTGVPSMAYFMKRTMMGYAWIQCTGERGSYQVNEVVLAMKSCGGDPYDPIGNKACSPLSAPHLSLFLEDLGKLENLTSLFLVNLNFGKTSNFQPPMELMQLTGLTNLVMTGNNLKLLPGSFANLSKLLWLDLSNNEIGFNFPTVLGELPKLYSLDLSSNEVVTLPEAVKNMKELVYFDLSNNQIAVLEIQHLNHNNAKLIDLRLRNNKLTALNAEMGEIVTLENADFGYNMITVLPNAIGGWKSLISLDVSGNRLTEIPSAIGSMTGLKVLRFKSNSVNEIPKEIKDMTNLEELDGTYNNILVVPTQIGQLADNLKILNLKSNRIPQLPKEIKALDSLELLNLDSNHLDSVPSLAEMKNLEYAYISNNQLECLPELPPGKTWENPGPTAGNFQADDVNKLRSCATMGPTKKPTPKPTEPSGAVSLRESSILVIGFSLLVASIALLQ